MFDAYWGILSIPAGGLLSVDQPGLHSKSQTTQDYIGRPCLKRILLSFDEFVLLIKISFCLDARPKKKNLTNVGKRKTFLRQGLM